MARAVSKAQLQDTQTNADIGHQVINLMKDLQTDFLDRNQLYKNIDDVIFLRNKVAIPEAFQATAVEVHSPLAPHITNTVTAALSINPPKVYFQPIAIGESGEENSAMRQNFFAASWLRQEREARRRLFRLFVHAVVTKGMGVFKTVERKKRAWANYDAAAKAYKTELDAMSIDVNSKDRLYNAKTEEMKRKAAYPIYTTDIPPETFYYTKNEDGFTGAGEIKEVPIYTTLAKYNLSIDSKLRVCPAEIGLATTEWNAALGVRRTALMYEWWDPEFVTYILAGPGDLPYSEDGTGSGKAGEAPTGWVFQRLRHSYGDKNLRTLKGPYFQALGTTTSSRKIEEEGLSVLFGFLYLFPLLDSLLTIQSQAAYTFGYPAYKRTSPPALGVPESAFGIDPEEEDANIERIVPGMIFPYDISPLEQPRSGVDLDKSIALVRSMLEMALPSTAAGVMSGDQSGYAINQAAHLARLAWDPIVSNVEFAMSERTGWESELIEEHIKERVYVWGNIPLPRTGKSARKYKEGWLSIGPDDLDGVHKYEVKLDPETPSNKVIELRTHSDMLKLKLETPDMAITAMGNDPLEVKRGWMLYELEQDPAIRNQQKQRVLHNLNTMDQEALSGGAKNTLPSGSAVPAVQAQTGLLVQPPQVAVATGPGPMTPPPSMPTMPAPAGMPMQQRNSPPGMTNVGTPGTPAGVPGGIRNTPGAHLPLPGEG